MNTPPTEQAPPGGASTPSTRRRFLPGISDRTLRLGKEAGWVATGQAAAAVGGVVGVKLMTHALRPVSYGELALGMTAATLAQQVLFSPISQALLRFFSPAVEEGDLGGFLRAARQLTLQATVIFGLLGAISALVLGAAGGLRWLPLLLGVLAFSVLSGYEVSLGAMQNAARQRVVVAWHDGLAVWLRFGVAAGLVALIGSRSSVAMDGYALGTLAVLGSQTLFFRSRILSRGREEATPQVRELVPWADKMRSYAWPFATWGAFTWAMLIADRWALQAFATTRDVGLYAALDQLGYYPPIFLSGYILQLVSPAIYSRAGDASDPERLMQARRLASKVVWAVFGGTAAASGLAFLTHRWIFALLVSPQYRSVSWLLPWMIFSGGLFACGQAASLPLMAGTRTGQLIVPKIATAVFGLAATFAGAYYWNIKGVVWASVLFSLSYLVWILRIAHTSTAPGPPAATAAE